MSVVPASPVAAPVDGPKLHTRSVPAVGPGPLMLDVIKDWVEGLTNFGAQHENPEGWARPYTPQCVSMSWNC
jgi:hypothetical protein